VKENVSSLIVNDEGGLSKGERSHSATDIIMIAGEGENDCSSDDVYMS